MQGDRCGNALDTWPGRWRQASVPSCHGRFRSIARLRAAIGKGNHHYLACSTQALSYGGTMVSGPVATRALGQVLNWTSLLAGTGPSFSQGREAAALLDVERERATRRQGQRTVLLVTMVQTSAPT